MKRSKAMENNFKLLFNGVTTGRVKATEVNIANYPKSMEEEMEKIIWDEFDNMLNSAASNWSTCAATTESDALTVEKLEKIIKELKIIKPAPLKVRVSLNNFEKIRSEIGETDNSKCSPYYCGITVEPDAQLQDDHIEMVYSRSQVMNYVEATGDIHFLNGLLIGGAKWER